ncbi:MAG TPA: hypothetical protein VGD84_13700 [Pseudonocardiaceae bacterium]
MITMPPRNHKHQTQIRPADKLATVSAGPLPPVLILNAAEQAVAAFDFRRDQVKIKWLKQFLKAGFSVSEGGSRRWLVSLVYPTGIMALVEVVDGWDVHNEWRRALPPT